MARFETYAQGTPAWIEHSSADPSASKEFYGRLFGWEWDEPMGEGADYSLALVAGARVAGLGAQTGDAQGGPASWGVYLAVDDVDAAVDRAAGAGGEVLVAPMDVGPTGRMAWLRDPGGAAVGLWQAGELAGAERANEPGTNIWNELMTTDFDAVAPFYADVLGMGTEATTMAGMDQPYHVLTVAGRTVAGSWPQPEGQPSVWTVCFNVDDCDATLTRASELGADVASEAVDLPGVGRFAGLRDPQGAEFGILQNPPGE